MYILENDRVEHSKTSVERICIDHNTRSVYINKRKTDVQSMQNSVGRYFFFFFWGFFFFFFFLPGLVFGCFFLLLALGLKMEPLTLRPEKIPTARLLLEGLGEALPRFNAEPAGLVELRPEPRYKAHPFYKDRHSRFHNTRFQKTGTPVFKRPTHPFSKD